MTVNWNFALNMYNSNEISMLIWGETLMKHLQVDNKHYIYILYLQW